MKKIAILGSTGSIGRSTLDVISRHKDAFRVEALTAGKNIDLLIHQIRAFNPGMVAVADGETERRLRESVNGVAIFSGSEGITTVASESDAEFVVSSIVGSAGLVPTIAAIRAGKTIGLANKESLVMAGEIVMGEALKNGVTIIPVDSEHSAVFQCIGGSEGRFVRKIILTASGGPFFNRKKEDLDDITADDALKHPNWSMGKKISIDSATLMNKGLEVIEASWLFGMPPEGIDVLIHPQSIVHSLVEFSDRSCIAQMSVPDMRGPISFALSYPERMDDPIPALELEKIGYLTFDKPDTESFPCLSYAYEAMEAGGTAPCVLNASNEVAVNAFLDRKIRFNDIPVVIRRTVDDHAVMTAAGLDDVLEADQWARNRAGQYVGELSQ